MSGRVYRLRMAELPPAEDRRELLELVLAAASLDIDVELLLSEGALGLVWPQIEPGWQQLPDHGLAEILLYPPPAWRGSAPPGVRVVGADTVPALPADGVEIRL